MNIVRKVVSLILLVGAVIGLIGFFIGSGTLVFDPIVDSFKGKFNFEELGLALYNFIEKLSLPLIMIILGLIGLTLDCDH